MSAVVTVGTFDGVHRGHQAVLDEVLRLARGGGGGEGGRRASVLVTFDRHPLEVVNPSAAPKLLTLPEEKRALCLARGVDHVVLLPFTTAVAQLDAEAFVRRLKDEHAMTHLVMGYDHGFGRGRSGDVAAVRTLGESLDFEVVVVDAVRDDGQPVSSTVIRAAVAHGELDAAARGLGRAYSIRGTVVRGAGRGRTIGIPTINLAPPDARKLLPPDGVYAVTVAVTSRETGNVERFGGMMNQGPRPTFGDQARMLEVHLFDFEGELYGAEVEVAWVRRLRDAQAFPSREALVAQLERDGRAARASLNFMGSNEIDP